MRRIFLSLLLGLTMAGCKPPSRGGDAVVLSPQKEEQKGEIKRYWEVPVFELTDQDARPFQSGQMLGKVWVVDFFYTTCPGPCPALNSRLSEIHRAFEGESRAAFLSISSDPEKDSPEVLKQYAQKFKADLRWLFLTGKTEAIFSLANQGFKLSLTRVEGAQEPLTHSTRLVLVDDSGWIRGFYEGVGEGSGEATEKLIADIKTLLGEMK
jgi:protein SCO1/2